MKKQTAVEWLVKELSQELDYIPIKQWDRIRDLVEQAKQMEKEQLFEYIRNLYCNGDASLKYHLEEFEQYYNKTYNNESQTNF